MLGSRPASLVHTGTGVIVSCGFFQCLPILGGFFVFIRSQLPSDTGTELSVEYWPANRGKYCLTLLERIYLLMYFSTFYTHLKGFLDCFWTVMRRGLVILVFEGSLPRCIAVLQLDSERFPTN